jgi:ABC-type lipoprotein export system ATPase subunit
MVTHDPHAAARAGRTLHLEKGSLIDQPSTPHERTTVPPGGAP